MLLGVPAMAGELDLGSALPPSPAAIVSHESDTANIRMHRLRHLEARLYTDPSELHAQCRFESEISTSPPKKHLALTFDDGPEPVQTEYILKVLKQHNARATFFMIGEQVKKYPDLVAMVLSDGHHLIANHSWSHPNFHDIDVAEQTLQVEKTELALAQGMRHKLFRYPYGNSSCEANTYLRQQGYQIVGWHIDSCDWAFDKSGSVDAKEAAICGVLPQFHSDYVGHVMASIRAHNGGIVLMHEIHPNTLKKLNEILQMALAEGFVFDSIDAIEFGNSMR
jgi:peptidoglycan/xylan/chitin deacetylase (PgdA/CDA1 family)